MLDLQGQPRGLAQRGGRDRRAVHRRRSRSSPPEDEPKDRPSPCPPRAGRSGECPSTSWSITTAPAPAKSLPALCKITSGPRSSGTRTYGKGSVQSIFSLRSAPAGLKLTTAKFYSPLQPALQRAGSAARHPHRDARLRQARRRRLSAARRVDDRRSGPRRDPRDGNPDGQEPAPRLSVRTGCRSITRFPRGQRRPREDRRLAVETIAAITGYSSQRGSRPVFYGGYTRPESRTAARP